MSDETALLALRVIAATAAKAADDLAKNKLWPGDLAVIRGLIEKHASDVREEPK